MLPDNQNLTHLLDALPSDQIAFSLIEVPIPNSQPPQTSQIITCPLHRQVVCPECGSDFASLNHMQQFLRAAPTDAIPPPPNMPPPPQRAEAIKMAKDQGNASFKLQQFQKAVVEYSRSADMALSRPPWEPSALIRDETAIALCNRSAAYAFGATTPVLCEQRARLAEVRMRVNALVDAEAVIALKKSWTKGHFRKARALVGLDELDIALDAISDGLQFDPNDSELIAFMRDIEDKLRGVPSEV